MARVCEIVRNELLILVGPHHGHCAGRCPAARGIELDGFGTWTRFDKSLQFDNRFGVAAYWGIFFVRNVALEGDVSITRTHFKSALPGTLATYRSGSDSPLTCRWVPATRG